MIDHISFDSLLAEADEFASSHEEHALVKGARPDDSLARLELDSAKTLNDETLVALLDTL